MTALDGRPGRGRVRGYCAAQLGGLKVSLPAAAAITLAWFAFTGHLPARRASGAGEPAREGGGTGRA
ncbi:hypothetical protein [Kitasatospora sp. NPDC001132]